MITRNNFLKIIFAPYWISLLILILILDIAINCATELYCNFNDWIEKE